VFNVSWIMGEFGGRGLRSADAGDRTIHGLHAAPRAALGFVLHASFLLRPGIPARPAHEVSFVAAVAVFDTVEPLLPMEHRVALKWSNDVGRCCCGGRRGRAA